MLTPLPYGAVEAWSIALWEVCVFTIVLLWGVHTAVEGRWTLAANPLALPMLGLLVVAIIQIYPSSSNPRGVISYDPYVTRQVAIRLFASLCFFLLFATFVRNDERRHMAAHVIIGICVFIALVGIGQSYIGKALWRRGAFGPFVNRNHFAGFLEMGVGMAGGLILGRTVRREWLAVYVSSALAMCAGIVLSASRGGVLALAAEIVFLVVIALPSFVSSRREGGNRRMAALIRAAGALVLGFGAIIGTLFLVGSEGLIENISQSQTEVRGELPASERFSRRDIWNATAGMIRDHPALGVGLGAFQFAYTRYDQSSGAQRVEQSHNDYLQIVADAGFVGGAIALLFLLLLFIRGLSAVQSRNRQKRTIVLGALTGCFAIAVHSFVEFNLQITANAQLFLALCALATPGRRNQTETEESD
ncbi:MAG: O-antigen ligase family protein [Blastocatellia bacterium]